MQQRFWESLLAINSVLWFVALAFLAYGFGMLVVSLEWRLFLLSLAIFIATSLSEIALTAVSH